MRTLSALRGPFLDARRTFSFAASATVPDCLLDSTAAKSTVSAERRDGPRRALTVCDTRNAKGIREPERIGCLTPVELDKSRRSCKRFRKRGDHDERCPFFCTREFIFVF